MDEDISFEYLIALVHFLAFCYLLFAPRSKIKSKTSRSATVIDALAGTLIVSMVIGLIWFFLWMLTFERVPHGLWGFAMALVALIFMTLIDHIRRK